MGGGGGVSICRLLAGVRLRRREDGVGPAATVLPPPNARPALAGVRPRPEKDLKSPGVGPFWPSAALLVGVKSRETVAAPLPASRGVAMVCNSRELACAGRLKCWQAAGRRNREAWR